MTEPAQPRIAATLMLARDGTDGLELFMVVRHHEIEFASGALVFPGGSVDPADFDPRWRNLAVGVDWASDEMLCLMAAAAREAFEECGVLFARGTTRGPLIEGARAEALGRRYRQAIERGAVGFADMIEREGLVAAFDRLVHFAHWITPPHMPKRFDTHFFLAEAPLDHVLRHDGRESVDSIWLTPAHACSEADAGRRTVLFPTQLNLEKVGRHRTVAEAIAAGRDARVVTVRPEPRTTDEGRILRIPMEAGYGAQEFLLIGGHGQPTRIVRRDEGRKA
ncbi:MAG: NUDIX hydrolase [Hyphomicrobiaceae bacterium]